MNRADMTCRRARDPRSAAFASFLARVLASLLLAASLAGPTASSADQRDPRLGELFAALAEVSDLGEALAVEATIWRLWLKAEDSTLDEIMARGVRAMNANRLSDAVERFTELIRAAPDFAEAWNKRGDGCTTS